MPVGYLVTFQLADPVPEVPAAPAIAALLHGLIDPDAAH